MKLKLVYMLLCEVSRVSDRSTDLVFSPGIFGQQGASIEIL